MEIVLGRRSLHDLLKDVIHCAFRKIKCSF
jgi:hypothetical protein